MDYVVLALVHFKDSFRTLHFYSHRQSVKKAAKSCSRKKKLTYTITIKGSSKVILSSLHGFDQVGSIGQVGVRVMPPKVLLGDTVHC